MYYIDGWSMGCNTTFNNISVIKWWSVLLVEETGISVEKHWPATSHWQTLSHTYNVVSSKTDRHNITEILLKVALKPHNSIPLYLNRVLLKPNCQIWLFFFQVFDSNGSFLTFVNTSADPLYGPQGLTVTPEGLVVVGDSGNHCFKVYKYLQWTDN
jgi:hypothetical protein